MVSKSKNFRQLKKAKVIVHKIAYHVESLLVCPPLPILSASRLTAKGEYAFDNGVRR